MTVSGRREFIGASAAFLATRALFGAESGGTDRYAALQDLIDRVTPAAWAKYRVTGDTQGLAAREALTDHNAYLVDFTTAFEITVGAFTIYHTGDCSTERKFRLRKPEPDLWIVHPRCGLDPVKGARAIRPKRTIVAHLNEMGHARDRWRWSWRDGLADAKRLAAAGFAAEVPVWGERIV